ncbi:hypothetical protein [Sulfobacillus thermosulfidooxidans]|uniref:hypothetical protein n=1 Tax=Sulfobacillus thermosulfidooxidans TaxID=28034 RepID=UPI000A8AFBAE|nr:hypothetical protein [Sulfobacillus thermosulfidooxidans]
MSHLKRHHHAFRADPQRIVALREIARDLAAGLARHEMFVEDLPAPVRQQLIRLLTS